MSITLETSKDPYCIKNHFHSFRFIEQDDQKLIFNRYQDSYFNILLYFIHALVPQSSGLAIPIQLPLRAYVETVSQRSAGNRGFSPAFSHREVERAG